MEYYSGYLVPIRTGHCYRSGTIHIEERQNSHLKRRIKKLEKALRKVQKSQRTHSQKENRYQSETRKRINSKQLQLQNRKLRQQNRILNEYFSVFSVKYDENRDCLQRMIRECKSAGKTQTTSFVSRNGGIDEFKNNLNVGGSGGKFSDVTKLSKYYKQDDDVYRGCSGYQKYESERGNL